MRYLLPLLLLVLAVPGRAQTPGNCELGTAVGELYPDGGEAYARVFNTGMLFFGTETYYANGYEVPLGSGGKTIFSSGFWVGGQVKGELRAAAARYTRYEFWPGPLHDGAVLPNASDCSTFDRIFVVSREDIADYLRMGVATDDLRDWPASWGAPVLDGDGVEGNYNLAGGDQPAIYGDQTAWWVMNDVGNVHEETGSNPLGIEVQVSAFGVGEGILPLRQATWYRYRIINRSSNTIDSAYVSFFTDLALGQQGDDYVGSDTTLNMGYGYNGDDFDGWPGYGYGSQPPAIGFKVVQGPVGLPNGRDDNQDGEIDEVGERLGLTAFTYFCNGCPQPATTDPRTKEEYYHHMQGRWKDGTPFTEFGDGFRGEGPVTRFAFPGDPVTNQCWSMGNACSAEPVNPSYLRFMEHTGPFRLGPGEETEIVFALPFGQGQDRLDSVVRLRQAAYAVQAAWDTGFLAPSRVEADALPPDVPGPIELVRPTPNPFTDRLTLRYSLPDALALRITVLDLLGREVAVLAQGEQAAGPRTVEVDTSGWPSGHYLVRVETGLQTETFTVVKRR